MQREARRTEPQKEKSRSRELYEWVQALVCSVLAVVVVFTFGIRLIGVDGHSMLPTLQDGDRLLVLNSMLCGRYEPGDIVVLRKESFLPTPIVKRVIAVEGQVVDIDFASGTVFVDGKPLQEAYINERTFTEEGTVFPLTVPEGSVFIMGDNRNHSTDSRDARLGTIDRRYIIGRAVFLALPGPDAGTGVRDYGRIGGIG
ncbi:signal peptidase I [uncultured Oscillibacter sp.]|uniref:signal peptidase I n=1 Tax=uncultured Oscillibacter sp. TaxID=876091 RepID=UPI00260C55EE|nr:signal peptidase I [uncultured Oscillibacter sp.]